VDPQPLVTVSDVEASSRWYQEVLGCRSAHGGPEYDCLVAGDHVVLQLHHADPAEHPYLGGPAGMANGFALWYQTDEFDAALERARSVGAEIVDGPLVNPNAQHRELWLRDLDGYLVVLAGKRGDLGDLG
jgi:catechol 2,3-dioxygenase-like lactoylglutathione lyase family enzyme